MPVYLLRHGESVGNRDALFSGIFDHPLTELGRRQSREARARFRGVAFARVYTSRLTRAIETADLFLASAGIEAPRRMVCAELNERDFGDYEARPQPPAHLLVEGEITWQICRDIAFVPTRGESMLQTHNRAVAFLESVRAEAGDTLMVAHGNVLRSVVVHYLGWPLELLPEMPSRNCLMTRLAC